MQKLLKETLEQKIYKQKKRYLIPMKIKVLTFNHTLEKLMRFKNIKNLTWKVFYL